MDKVTKNTKWPQVVRFWYPKPADDEYLVECRVECKPPEDHESGYSSAPCLYTVHVIRAENCDGEEVSADTFLDCWGDLEYFAVQAAEYENILPRFFANELQQAESYAKEMARQFSDAEYYLEQAQWRYKDAHRKQLDAAKEVNRIREIQKEPAA